RGTAERKTIRSIADVLEKSAVGIEHSRMPAETPLTMGQQHNDTARSCDEFRTVDPNPNDLVRAVAKKPECSIPWPRGRQFSDVFDAKRPGCRAPVVRCGKQPAGGRDAAVVPETRTKVAKQWPRTQQRRRPISNRRVSRRKFAGRVEPALSLRGRRERRRVAVVVAVDADVVPTRNDL